VGGDSKARRRGRALEYRVAERLGGHVHAGQAGDVVVGDWVVECKYRAGYRLDRLTQLGEWVEQAKTNMARQGKGNWALVVYGGRGTEYLVVLSLEAFRRLLDAAGGTAARSV